MPYEEEREGLLTEDEDTRDGTVYQGGRATGGRTIALEADHMTAEDGSLIEQDGADGAEPPGDLTTVCEAFWNICNTIQGLPILAIPYTFKSGGYWSLITLVIVAVASLYTSQILVKSLYEEKDGIRVRVRNSYMDIGEAFWKNGGKWLVLMVMVIELVFVSTMYPILVGKCIIIHIDRF